MMLFRNLLFLFILIPTFTAAATTTAPVRIGLLSIGSHPSDLKSPTWSQLLASLRVLGWVEGKTAQFVPGFGAGNIETLERAAAEIARAKPVLVFTTGNAEAAAMFKATKDIPVVMVHASDPIGLGHAQSLRKPGGNMTGLVVRAPGLLGKQLEMLREAVPKAKRVAIIMGAQQPAELLRDAELAAPKLGITLVRVLPGTPEGFEALFAQLAREGVQAYVAPLDGLTFPHRARFCAAAAKARMPGIGEIADYAAAGCLLSYGANLLALCRRAAAIGDKILRGARPADIPIEQPTHFDLMINGKTAQELGVNIPASLLVRAERVIE